MAQWRRISGEVMAAENQNTARRRGVAYSGNLIKPAACREISSGENRNIWRICRQWRRPSASSPNKLAIRVVPAARRKRSESRQAAKMAAAGGSESRNRLGGGGGRRKWRKSACSRRYLKSSLAWLISGGAASEEQRNHRKRGGCGLKTAIGRCIGASSRRSWRWRHSAAARQRRGVMAIGGVSERQASPG